MEPFGLISGREGATRSVAPVWYVWPRPSEGEPRRAAPTTKTGGFAPLGAPHASAAMEPFGLISGTEGQPPGALPRAGMFRPFGAGPRPRDLRGFQKKFGNLGGRRPYNLNGWLRHPWERRTPVRPWNRLVSFRERRGPPGALPRAGMFRPFGARAAIWLFLQPKRVVAAPLGAPHASAAMEPFGLISGTEGHATRSVAPVWYVSPLGG